MSIINPMGIFQRNSTDSLGYHDCDEKVQINVKKYAVQGGVGIFW